MQVSEGCGADTLNDNVIELKEDVNKIMNENTCEEYMTINLWSTSD